jgi:NO-binding membrane sensor protein with MHYT domain
MESYELISICLSALIAVFLILSLLAIFMRLITELFSVKENKEDSAIIAALSTIVSQHYPGTKITKIEESK